MTAAMLEFRRTVAVQLSWKPFVDHKSDTPTLLLAGPAQAPDVLYRGKWVEYDARARHINRRFHVTVLRGGGGNSKELRETSAGPDGPWRVLELLRSSA